MHEQTIATAPPERPVTPDADGTSEVPRAAGADVRLADDPHVLQILTTEHWSLLTARSLAYNEAFTRASMFLTFLSMSFVAMALLTQATGFTGDFLIIAAIVLGFDFLIGVVTFIRVAGTGYDDLRATQGMNRVRNAYVRIAPDVAPFLITGTNDDIPSVLKTYGFTGRETGGSDFVYGLSTSLGLVGIVMSLVGGVEAAVVALLFGATATVALGVAAVATLVIFGLGVRWAFAQVARHQAALDVRFPTGADVPTEHS